MCEGEGEGGKEREGEGERERERGWDGDLGEKSSTNLGVMPSEWLRQCPGGPLS